MEKYISILFSLYHSDIKTASREVQISLLVLAMFSQNVIQPKFSL